MILYHGTNNKFNKFSKDKIGNNTKVTTVGYFFTDNLETAKSYGDIVLKCEVDLGNYIECDFNNTCHTFFIDKEYTPSELAKKVFEINEYLEANSDIRNAFDIDLDIEYDEEGEPIYPDNYYDEQEIKDYIDSLGTYNHLCDDKIDSIICKNVKDNMDFGGHSCNNYIVFDENRIKILETVNESLTNSSLKRWFGNSKVIDNQGNPLVVYHGSPEKFEIFEPDRMNYGSISRGFCFFTNKKSAYPNCAKDYAGKNGYIYECYLKIEKPLHLHYKNTPDNYYHTPIHYWDTCQSDIRREYRKGDYDGIIIENENKDEDDSVIYLVPNPYQIKSIYNKGNWSWNSHNVYEQLNKEVERILEWLE